MCPVIRISDSLYSRIERHAKGFDTPAAVLERLLNEYEGVENVHKAVVKPTNVESKPEIVFYPANEPEFLKRLVDNGACWVYIYKEDGSVEHSVWYANKMTLDSNLRANIWSGKLRGWKDKKIVRAEYFIDPKDLPK